MKGEAFGFLGALACLSVIPANLRHDRLFFCPSRPFLSFPLACGGNPSALLFGWIPATYRGDDERQKMDPRLCQ